MLHTRSRSQRPVPTLPHVNLLSPATLAAARRHRRHRRLGISVAGILAAALALGLAQQQMISAAQADLAAAKHRQTTLQADQRSLAYVDAYYSDINQARNTISRTMSKEAMIADTLRRLTDAAPTRVRLGQIRIDVDTTANTRTAGTRKRTTSNTASEGCPSVDPFTTPATVGCIALTATAPDREAVGAFITALDRDPRFTNVFVSTTTRTDTGIAFSATVGITEGVYSHRYDDTTFLNGTGKGASK